LASFGRTTCTISVSDSDTGFDASDIEKARSVRAAIVEKCLQPHPKRFREIVLGQRLHELHGRAEAADKIRAVRAAAQMLFEVAADIRWKTAIEILGEKRDDARTAGGH
jgi:hypothetical protein